MQRLIGRLRKWERDVIAAMVCKEKEKNELQRQMEIKEELQEKGQCGGQRME